MFLMKYSMNALLASDFLKFNCIENPNYLDCGAGTLHCARVQVRPAAVVNLVKGLVAKHDVSEL